MHSTRAQSAQPTRTPHSRPPSGRPASAVFTSRTPHTIHEEDSVADSLDDNVIPAEVGEPSLRQQEHALRHHARWESQHARQAQSLCKAGGRAPDQLLMLTGHQAREKAEMLELLHKAKPFNERNGAASFAMSMRNCHERWESVGGPLSGLWTSTKEPRNIFGDFQVHRMPELRTGALSRSRPQSAQLARAFDARQQQAAFVHRPGSGRPGSGRTSSSGRSRPMSASAAAGAGARHSIGGAQAAHKRFYEKAEGPFADARKGKDASRMRRMSAVGFDAEVDPSRVFLHGGRVHIHDAVEAEAAAARAAAAAEEEAAASRAAAAAREERRAERAAAEAAAAAEKAAAAAAVGPALSLDTERLFLQAAAGGSATAVVEMTNTGTTALFLRFAKTQRSQAPVPPPHLAAALGVPRERFFCRHDGHAAVLPGAKCRVEFVFTSKLPGAFLESWELHTTPPTTADGGAAATLQLRGVALAAPPGKAASVMEATLAKRQVRHAVEDILLTSVVRAAIDRVDARIAAPPAAAPSAEAAKYELWQSANAHRGLYYDAAMWHAFDAAASEIAPLTYEPGAWDGDVSKLERAAAALPARSAERAAAVARVGSLLEECSAPPAPPPPRPLYAAVRAELCALAEAIVPAADALCAARDLAPPPAAPVAAAGADADGGATPPTLSLSDIEVGSAGSLGGGGGATLVLRQDSRELWRAALGGGKGSDALMLADPDPNNAPPPAPLRPAHAYGGAGALSGLRLELWSTAALEAAAEGDGAAAAAWVDLGEALGGGGVRGAVRAAPMEQPPPAAEATEAPPPPPTLSLSFVLGRGAPPPPPPIESVGRWWAPPPPPPDAAEAEAAPADEAAAPAPAESPPPLDGRAAYVAELHAGVGDLLSEAAARVDTQVSELFELHAAWRPAEPTAWEAKKAENDAFANAAQAAADAARAEEEERAAEEAAAAAKKKGRRGKK